MSRSWILPLHSSPTSAGVMSFGGRNPTVSITGLSFPKTNQSRNNIKGARTKTIMNKNSGVMDNGFSSEISIPLMTVGTRRID